MPLISVTRLRLRDPKYRDEFLASAFAVVEQATQAQGNLGADVLADAGDTYWTRTIWSDRDGMRGFLISEPHLGTMGHIDEWCDEATFLDWEQTSADPPDWQAAYRRLIADGHVSPLTDASETNATRAFPAPVES